MGIRLSDRTREHIAERHPEVKPYIALIAEAVSEPDTVSKGRRGEYKALKLYPKLPIGPKYLMAVYLEEAGDKVIMTAYFTSDARRVKGEVVWRRPP